MSDNSKIHYTPTLLQRFVRDNWPGGNQPAMLNITTSSDKGAEAYTLELGVNLIGVHVLRSAKYVDINGTVTEWQDPPVPSALLGTDSDHGGWHSGATCMTFSLGDASITFEPPQAKAA